jgi:hypothetical protein
MNNKTKNLIATLALAPLALLASASAWATPVAGTYFNDNDCSGVFGQGFDTCKVGNSPIIAKGNVASTAPGGFSWQVNSLFPSVTGGEWSITSTDSGRQGSFVYTPGANDPLITYFVAKLGNDFILYGLVGALAGGQQTGSWNSADAGTNPPNWPATDDRCVRNPTNQNCLPSLKMGGGLSHLSFYDTRVPVPTPEPTSLALLGLGLLGAGLARRRKAS